MNISKRRTKIIASLLAVFIGVLFLLSCGEDYEKPSTTLNSSSSLISASTLKSWMDAGKVNGTGYDRVVILDINSYATYTQNHIPGALFVDSGDIGQNRNDGIGVWSYEVLDGAKMDDLTQRYGIDGNTTIVFTSTSSLVNPTRAYFTFRYWGFPKNRLKVLDGLNPAWGAAYGLTPGNPPVVARTKYSVKNNGQLRDDLRVSLAEMIDYADGKVPNALAIDVRGTASSGSYAGVRGSTNGGFSSGSNQGKTVFEGRIKGAKAMAASSLYSGTTFLPADQLVSAFTSTSIGLDSTRTAYVYCVKGAQSSVTFFVLDGILGWPSAVYDGSWSQWGQLSGNTSMKGTLDPNSPWRTDAFGRSDLVVYNYESPLSAVTSTAPLLLTASGPASIATTATYTIRISQTGTPDLFDWLVSSSTTTGVSITGLAQSLNNGVSITFADTTFHAVGDFWTFTATARRAIEQLTADGSACWATYLASGLTANIFGSTSACLNTPTSFDTNLNRVEDADKAYISSGGSGGSSGGGTGVPAGC